MREGGTGGPREGALSGRVRGAVCAVGWCVSIDTLHTAPSISNAQLPEARAPTVVVYTGRSRAMWAQVRSSMMEDEGYWQCW